MRTRVKRFLIAGYCWHLIPGFAVTAGFRLFDLEAA